MKKAANHNPRKKRQATGLNWEFKQGTTLVIRYRPVAIGDGVIGIAEILRVLKGASQMESTSPEVGGDEGPVASYGYPKSPGAE